MSASQLFRNTFKPNSTSMFDGHLGFQSMEDSVCLLFTVMAMGLIPGCQWLPQLSSMIMKFKALSRSLHVLMKVDRFDQFTITDWLEVQITSFWFMYFSCDKKLEGKFILKQKWSIKEFNRFMISKKVRPNIKIFAIVLLYYSRLLESGWLQSWVKI